jgi:hypothetical protein
VTGLGQQKILRLQITVQDVHRVQMLEGEDDGRGVETGFRGGSVEAVLMVSSIQLPSHSRLDQEVQRVVCLKGSEQLHDEVTLIINIWNICVLNGLNVANSFTMKLPSLIFEINVEQLHNEVTLSNCQNIVDSSFPIS